MFCLAIPFSHRCRNCYMSGFCIEQIPYEIASLNDPASVFDKPCFRGTAN